jgi:uncharacterized membrane protein
MIMFYLILSTIGAALIIMIFWFRSSEIRSINPFDKMFVGGAFISSCIFGLSLALKPNWVGRFVNRGSKGHGSQKVDTTKRKRQAHHPDCEPFEGHTITINKKVRCAGCTGLALGSTVSIVLMIFYVVLPYEIPPTPLYILIILGMILIALNYLDLSILNENAHLHLISNTFLVIGFFLIVISVFEKTGSITYGLLAVVLSFLWLDTRIQLSDWHHSLTCKSCGNVCKVY